MPKVVDTCDHRLDIGDHLVPIPGQLSYYLLALGVVHIALAALRLRHLALVIGRAAAG